MLGTVSSPLTTIGSLLTRTYDVTGAAILTGVAALRFVMIDNGLAGSGTVFREIDVLGTAISSNPSDHNAWAANYPGTDLTNPAADADGDGMTNQQEYAFGLDPSSGSSVSPITMPLDPVTGHFQYTRRASSGRTYTNSRIWYRRSFETPPQWKGRHTLLHFGAVDWEATVYRNGLLTYDRSKFTEDPNEVIKQNAITALLSPALRSGNRILQRP